ncbi:putative bifunctional diguanylate cyclase/phosphodiesterase [Rhodopila sp.]|uniref:putative bifunctional diguanylate cyclase/phosphodiesterase n=1 Tax=Rhodopila sp. TaxID=2480087 RepID=UPI003D0D1AEF
MDDLLTPVSRMLANGPAEAYAELATGVLVVDAGGLVIFANASASAFLTPLHPIGLGLGALFGLSGASGGGDLARAVEAGIASEPIRIGLSDGRILDGRSRPLADGGTVVTLFDVTLYVQDAERAASDSLTGLANRASLHTRLGELLAQARLGNSSVAVVYLDLDRFKSVNDTLGHSVGDALLIKVAERIRAAARADDMIARLGGDEFAILQANAVQPQAAEALAARLVDLISRTYIAAGHMLTIGASVGVAIAPSDGDDAETLLKHADLALYRAKADGRGVFRFFQDSMDVEVQARRLLEMDLRRALALKELELFYQPQIDLESDMLVGFEALIRWRSPARGLVSPALFITLAEEIGLIAAIGEWVLRTACREAASWPRPVSIAVNISPIQFRGGKLVQTVKSALAASKLDPSRLEVEITEGALLDNTDTVLQVLHELKALGIRISMDDFGTGYSSLSYLQKFPFDKIKIDQSFVRGADHSAGSGAIVRAVAALGASLGMTTTAEGVETKEQLDRVRAEGCTSVQGYLTGRPIPAADAAALMRLPVSLTDTAGEGL